MYASLGLYSTPDLETFVSCAVQTCNAASTKRHDSGTSEPNSRLDPSSAEVNDRAL